MAHSYGPRIPGSLIPAECSAVLWQDDARGPFLAPTVVDDPDPASALMQSEIFGPILPIVTVGSAAEAVAFVNARARPLALYVFAADADAERVVAATTSGGACVNDTIFQISNPHLPFGGVGASGMGRYHGKNGFDELSHARLFLFYRFVAGCVRPGPKYGRASCADDWQFVFSVFFNKSGRRVA